MRKLEQAGVTTDGRPVVSGRDVFELKDTHGIPFSVSFYELNRMGAEMDWVGLVNAARDAGWWDFQTMASISEGFSDSGVWGDRAEEIKRRLMTFMVNHPHPGLS